MCLLHCFLLARIDSLTQLESLYEQKEYRKVADIVKTTFSGGFRPTYGRTGRPAQIGMLLHSLWYTDQADCLVWAEECLHETLDYLLVPSPDRSRWEMVIRKCLAMLLEIIERETVSISTITGDFFSLLNFI